MTTEPRGTAFFRALLQQRTLVLVLLTLSVGYGAFVAPFGWWPTVSRDTVPVDAIPDIGENQQVVFTAWPGRSPADIEAQVTYPLASALLGVPRVKTVRSTSMFGFSMVYLIFEEGAEFYWTRARIAEKLASLPPGLLPEGVAPMLGPDATALGQVFWYTLEAQDAQGRPVGGFDLDELRTVQDFQVRYALAAAEGVSEVASIGGFVRELQVDVDPDALRAWGITLGEVANAVRAASAEVGAQSLEMSGVEYSLRSVGFVGEAADLEHALVAMRDGTPVRIRDVAEVGHGPAARRGALTRSGEEAVGGVVTARHGANPRQVIENVRTVIEEITPSLPRRTLEDGTVAHVRVVPFYDRSELIDRTVGTLETALTQQILITILVVLLLLMHLRASALIATLLPAAVLLTFVAMLALGIEANVVALAGIAIAIGTMVDVGVVVTENIVQRLREEPDAPASDTIARATAEVAGAVFTALATTVISFLPVFALTGQEGKLFGPLAWTKTLALVLSLVIALLVLPVLAHLLLGGRVRGLLPRRVLHGGVALLGVVIAIGAQPVVGMLVVLYAAARLADDTALPARLRARGGWVARVLGTPLADRVSGLSSLLLAVLVAVVLALHWLPLGATVGEGRNIAFVLLIIGAVLGLFRLFLIAYRPLLYWILTHKALFLPVPALLVLLGALIWLGYPKVLGPLPESFHRSAAGQWLHVQFPGLNREFMPQLDEGMFLYMPSTMPHASVGSTLEMTRELDLLFESVPEVAWSVGKLGRAESPLDPAPVAMLETVIAFHPEYVLDDRGRRVRFAVDAEGHHLRTEDGNLVEDPGGRPFRLWRDHIRTSRDIWDELVAVGEVAGLTSAPLLQPISTRIVMLSSGIRAPMAIRLQGPDLHSLGEAALAFEALLRDHPMVNRPAVSADRPVGTPWIEIHPDREALAAYGVTMRAFQDTVEVAVGGQPLLQSVRGRERFPIRVRYPRELRATPEDLARVLVDTAAGGPVPLGDLAELRFAVGPEMIRSENGQLVAFVMFDRAPEFGEVQAIEGVRDTLVAAQEGGELDLADGVVWTFAGAWEDNVRAAERLQLLMPVVIVLILALLMLQFRSVALSLFILSGVAVAFSGGFILLWLYGQPGFLDVDLLGANLREVFRVEPTALSVAVWVGFIALFGIATDDGVVMGTYLQQRFAEAPPSSIDDIRARVIEAGSRRVRPCLMTTATTILALLPVLTSYGTGADVMTPMALPAVGGMAIALLTLFVVPTLYCAWAEARWRANALAVRFLPDETQTAA